MINGFHIELTNICTLKCAGCARTQFIDMFSKNWVNHSLNISDLMNFLDIDLTNLEILLCGHYGDPIYHPDFHNILSQLKSRGARTKMGTKAHHVEQNAAQWRIFDSGVHKELQPP